MHIARAWTDIRRPAWAASLAATLLLTAELPAASIAYLGENRQAGLSAAVVVEGCALAHTAQLLPLDKQGRLIGEGSVDAQLAQALFNLETALAAAGSDTDHLVKVIPNWAKDASNPLVARLMRELQQSGAEHLYQAMLMWVLKNPNVCCAAVGMSAVNEVVEDCAAVGRRLTRRHRDLLELYAAAATGDYCRMCETCLAACPVGIRIPDLLRYRMYYKNYGHRDDARERYAAVPPDRQATACTRCGACQEACPNRLAIIEKLEETHRLLA